MQSPNRLKTVATGFAGAAALAAGSEAYGAVVASTTLPANYTPTSTTSDYEPSWDIDGDGTADFQFVFYQKSGNAGLNWLSGSYGYGGVPAGNAPEAYITGIGESYVNRLSAGATIGPSSTFNQVMTSSKGYFNVLASRYKTKLYGQWKTVTDGYMGFEFAAADGEHYGYVEIKTSRYVSAANPGGIFFSNGFYETTPGMAITIPVPEPGTLAALAFGAAILGGAALRRRKAQA